MRPDAAVQVVRDLEKALGRSSWPRELYGEFVELREGLPAQLVIKDPTANQDSARITGNVFTMQARGLASARAWWPDTLATLAYLLHADHTGAPGILSRSWRSAPDPFYWPAYLAWLERSLGRPLNSPEMVVHEGGYGDELRVAIVGPRAHENSGEPLRGYSAFARLPEVGDIEAWTAERALPRALSRVLKPAAGKELTGLHEAETGVKPPEGWRFEAIRFYGDHLPPLPVGFSDRRRRLAEVGILVTTYLPEGKGLHLSGAVLPAAWAQAEFDGAAEALPPRLRRAVGTWLRSRIDLPDELPNSMVGKDVRAERSPYIAALAAVARASNHPVIRGLVATLELAGKIEHLAWVIERASRAEDGPLHVLAPFCVVRRPFSSDMAKEHAAYEEMVQALRTWFAKGE